jgi:hypothetical protein
VGQTKGERDLLEPAMSLLEDHLGYPRESMLAEVSTPWGRPDLVAFNLPAPNPQTERVLSRSEIVLLSMLGRMGPLGESEMAYHLGMKLSSVRSQLDGLLSRGLVEEIGGAIAVSGQWSHLDSVCAIELKLRDWRRGLLQALRYRVFADLVYLFLARIPASLKTQAFSENGIGLLRLGDSTEILLAAEPVSAHNLAHARMLVEENIRRGLASPRQRPFGGTQDCEWLSSSDRVRSRKPQQRRSHRTRSHAGP